MGDFVDDRLEKDVKAAFARYIKAANELGGAVERGEVLCGVSDSDLPMVLIAATASALVGLKANADDPHEAIQNGVAILQSFLNNATKLLVLQNPELVSKPGKAN